MSSIEYINKIINEVIVEVDNLIVEQSNRHISGYTTLLKDPNATDEEKIQKIIDAQDQTISQSERIDIDDIYDDLSSGRWPKDFPSEAELEKHFQDETNTTYTIQDGKNKGKKITAGGYQAMRAYRGTKSIKSRVASGQKKKGKGHASVCYCVGFARQFSPDRAAEDVKCPPKPNNDKRACKKQWLSDLDTWRNSQNEYTKKIADEYEQDCLSRYENEMFDRETRDLYVYADSNVPNTPYCANWDEEIKSNLSGIESGLSSLLSKYFRVKNAKNLQVKAQNGSVADKLIMYKEIEIKFDPHPKDYKKGGDPDATNTAAPFDDCESHFLAIKKGDSKTFEVISASSLNKGKTVFLKKGNKYLLMTFGSAERDVPQAGSIKFCDDQGTPKCKQIKWQGKIVRLISS